MKYSVNQLGAVDITSSNLLFLTGGHGTFSNLVNNLVHVIMYFYYMMSALGPQYQKYIWWKKHLTTLQLVSLQSSFYINLTYIVHVSHKLSTILLNFNTHSCWITNIRTVQDVRYLLVCRMLRSFFPRFKAVIT